MGTLKEDYKDAMFEGQRAYQMTQNEDGLYHIEDATEYTQEGDAFGAKDINATNKAVNRLNHVTEVTLKVSGWTGSAAPYTQTVEVSGVTEEDNLLLVSALYEGASLDVQKAYAKAFGIVASGVATVSNGSVTFNVYKLPAVDITVGLKGV